MPAFDMILPSKRIRYSSDSPEGRDKSLPPGSLHKPLGLTHQGAESKRKKKNYNPEPVEWKPNLQKVRQMRWQRSSLDEGKR